MNACPTPADEHLYLWDGLLLYAAGGHRNDWHSHYAASLIISLDAPFQLELREGIETTVRACVLAPNTENRVSIEGRFVSLLADIDSSVFEPLAPLLNGRAWAEINNGQLTALLPRLRELHASSVAAEQVRPLVDDCIEAISGQRPRALAVTLDRRISKVLQAIREALPAEPATEELAATVGLSRSRLLHLFKEQLGLPIGQYLLWRRLFEAARLWDEGLSMADAAHAAGFYDQSHYTRTMRKMLDVTPSGIVGNKNLTIHHCWRNQ
jgi:AraC-like DNA-binding protein